ETVIRATQFTPQSLFYMPPGSLVHKFVVTGERSRIDDDDVAETTRALREMLTAGRLSKLITAKGEGGQLETRLVEQEGPIAYAETTTLSKVFNEDENRCISLHTDERPEQTENVIARAAEDYAFPLAASRQSQEIVLRHHAMQRLLEPGVVVIPWAGRVG